MAEQLFTVQIYTPNSDLAAGTQISQVIAARTGNDTLLGYQPISGVPNLPQIDLFIGDVTIEDPASRQWSDTFVFGDYQQAYYDNGNPQILGLNDFGFVGDFNPAQDFIQLNGNANNYQLLDVGVGSAILQQDQNGVDVVGFLLGNSNLNLASNYFKFEGNTPPPGPVVPKAQQQGTAGFDISVRAATDTSGNVYTAGGTTGSIGKTNSGLSRDGLVTKYDSQGNVLFTKQIGTSSFDTVSNIATDAQGNFYVSGITAGNLEGTKQAESTDAFVAKYDSSGNQVWLEQFGQNVIFQAFGLDVDAGGNVYVSGLDVRASEDLATDNLWVSKFDTNGSQQWFTEVGSVDNDFDESYDVTVSSDGSVYATGWTLGDLPRIDSPGSFQNAGLYDNYIAKFDNATGQAQWVKQYGTPDYEWSWGVDTDSQGNVYTAGWTLGTLGDENKGSYDVYLTKYDSEGNQLWVKQFGSAADDEGFDIFIDQSDNIFLTGYTNGNLEGINAGSFDAFVTRFDTAGNQIWLQQFGTSKFDQAYGVTSDAFGNLYVTGVTGGSLGSLNAGSFDAWTAKLDATSGSLKDFSGNGQTVSLASIPKGFASSAPATRPVSGEQADYIGDFFQQFVTGTLGLSPDSGGPSGRGLEPLVSNPYGGQPPTSVPEPSAGLGLLAIAGVACIRRKLQARSKAASKARTRASAQ
ncbi:SBBP repeat-containing protein [Leptolyngbya sp. FACHB-261]|uniref:SBBP repeat-containing protein n=1 Tax=Leptolyngbya sp. FACHB-261 TaxID=2692806 RepID=UPI0018EFE044|nr:SBBP repeat-containing protein [Leptolyngbya sp. FACHB-261]